MCSEEFSTARETWQKIYNKKSYNIQSAPISDSYFNLSDYKNLKTLTLMGGEPAIHPTTHKILDNFISAGNSKNISISLNTNSSKLDQVLIDKLKLFNVLSVTLSIDSVGKYFEYQRRPLKWNQVKNVANKWMEICNNIVINYVVTAISIWGFNDFIEWFTSFPQSIQNKNPRVIFVHVFTVEYLGLSVLNEDQRMQWIRTAVDHPFKNEIIKIIESTKYDPTLIPILKDNITLEDTTSEIKFAEIFPDWELNGKA
jgi:sulfatase maturation enzyme AslB (radical SAM superfamily)